MCNSVNHSSQEIVNNVCPADFVAKQQQQQCLFTFGSAAGSFISEAFSCWPSASTPYLLSCWSCLQMWSTSFDTEFSTDIWQLNSFRSKIDMIFSLMSLWPAASYTDKHNVSVMCISQYFLLCILCLTITWISQVLTSCQNNVLSHYNISACQYQRSSIYQRSLISALVNIWKFGLNVKLGWVDIGKLEASRCNTIENRCYGFHPNTTVKGPSQCCSIVFWSELERRAKDLSNENSIDLCAKLFH